MDHKLFYQMKLYETVFLLEKTLTVIGDWRCEESEVYHEVYFSDIVYIKFSFVFI